MALLSESDRKRAIERAIEDGAIPTDEPIWQFYVDHYCPECESTTRGIEQVCVWSHIGSAYSPSEKRECWYCGCEELQLKTWATKWNAPLDRLPTSAIPDEYRHD